MKRCYGCMREYEEGNVCPHCGYDNNAKPKEIYHIIPGTILEGRYIVGRSVGQGGFGITYIGWDLQLERRVAIKEYFPSDFATRVMGEHNLTIYNGEAGEQFGAGLKSFIEEAQRLAKFNGIKGVVDIYDTFITNNTGYIVMEFLSGISVKDMLKANKVIDYPTAKEIVVEMLYILREVHKDGIIHRDIAPDNIYITDEGEFKLLDFGAARYATTIHSKSLSVILKPGYAPEEQYRSHGNQGPWTDIYALAATFYKLITGVTPPESMERRADDKLEPPSKLGINIPKNDEIALLNALNILPENRIQSAQEFLDALGGKKVTRKKERNLHTDTGKMYKFVIPLISSAALIVAAFFICIQTGIIDIAYLSHKLNEVELNLPEGYEVIPNMVGENKETAKKIFEDNGFIPVEGEAVYDDYIEENNVVAQTPGISAKKEGTEILLILSKGPKRANAGIVLNRTDDEVIAELKELGFYNVTVRPGTENKIMNGYIERAEANGEKMEDNGEYNLSSQIVLYVSDGSDYEIDTTQDVNVPNYVGRKYESIVDDVMDRKLRPSIAGYEYSDRYDKDEIISQSPSGGSVKEGSEIRFVLSLGEDEGVIVPNVMNSRLDSARSEIEDRGLVCSVVYDNSPTVREGLVMSQSPEGGSRAERGARVVITVSRGSEPVPTTEPPTQPPTQPPTERPTERPTEAPTQPTTSYVPLNLDRTSANLMPGDACTIRASKTVRGVSSNESVAAVNGMTIYAYSDGVAVITFTSNDGDSASVTVYVETPPDPTLSVSSTDITLEPGEAQTVNISINNNLNNRYEYEVYTQNKRIANYIGTQVIATSGKDAISGTTAIVVRLYEKGNPSKIYDEVTINVRVKMSDLERERIEQERRNN